MIHAAGPKLKELLLAGVPRLDLPIPLRGKRRRRTPRAVA
jgi:hypothetical protein